MGNGLWTSTKHKEKEKDAHTVNVRNKHVTLILNERYPRTIIDRKGQIHNLIH